MAGSVGRLFVEIGAKSTISEDLQKSIQSLEEFGVKATSSGKRFLESFEASLNPTKQLAEQLSLLEKAGKSSGDILAVMGDRIKAATATATAHGQAIPPVVQHYAALGQQSATTGLSIEGLGKTLTDFAKNPIEAAKAGIGGFLEKLGPTAAGIAGVATAAIAAVGALVRFAEASADNYERLENLSAMTGIAVGDLQALEEITKEAGLAGMDLGRMIGKLNEQLGDSKPNEFTDAMARMGISVRTSMGDTKSAVTVLDEMRAVLLSIEDPTQRAQLAQQALGGRLRELIPLLVNSDKSLQDNIESTKEWVATSEEANAVLKDLDKLFDSASKVGAYFKKEVVEGLTISLKPLIDALNLAASLLPKFVSHIDISRAGLIGWKKEISAGAEGAVLFGRAAEEAAKKAVAAAKKVAAEVAAAEKETSQTLKAFFGDIDAYLIKSVADWQKAEYAKQQALVKTYEQIVENTSAIAMFFDEYVSKGTAALDEFQSKKDIFAGLPGMDKESINQSIKNSKAGWDTIGAQAKTFGGQVRQEISTVFNDISKDIAHSIMTWSDPGGGIMNSLKAFGEGMLRILIDKLLNPLEQALTKLIGSFVDKLYGKASSGSVNIPTSGTGTGGTGAIDMKELGVGGIAAMVAYNAQFVYNAIKDMANKSNVVKMWEEAQRDLGISLGVNPKFNVDSPIIQFMAQLGLVEEKIGGIRKDLSVSPLFLTEFAYPIAKATGQLDEFLASLENIQTAWGTANFRDPFEEWLRTGSVAALNTAFTDLFSQSTSLIKIMPDWAKALLAVADATDDITEAVGRGGVVIEQFGRTTGNVFNVLGNRIVDTSKGMGSALGGAFGPEQGVGSFNAWVDNTIGGLNLVGEALGDFSYMPWVDNSIRQWDSLRNAAVDTCETIVETATSSQRNMVDLTNEANRGIVATLGSCARAVYDTIWVTGRGIEEVVGRATRSLEALGQAFANSPLGGAIGGFDVPNPNARKNTRGADTSLATDKYMVQLADGRVVDLRLGPVGSYITGQQPSEVTIDWSSIWTQFPQPSSGRQTEYGTIEININGPVYGLDDLDKIISSSINRTISRGGLSGGVTRP